MIKHLKTTGILWFSVRIPLEFCDKVVSLHTNKDYKHIDYEAFAQKDTASSSAIRTSASMASSIPSPTSSPSCSNDLWEGKDRNAEKSLSKDLFCIYHYKLTNLKYQAITVNSAKENCGNPQKFYVELIKVLFLQKKNAEIRKNLSCYDYK